MKAEEDGSQAKLDRQQKKKEKQELREERRQFRKAMWKDSRYSSSSELRWDRLDNTAHIFPVIAGESLSNVYRIFVTLKEDIDKNILQQALGIVLPKFDVFNVRLQKGVFWYYFEENGKPAPKVREEAAYPCRYIVQNKNRSYMFRVTYFKNRINLEVFHVLTDGMGGFNFLKELTYQYLRIAHPALAAEQGDTLTADTSLNREDSFLKNYRKSSEKGYKTKPAYLIKGERLPSGEFGVIHGFMKINQLKDVTRKYGVSINEYLVATFVWSTYTELMLGMQDKKPIRVAVPVNLRPFYKSVTTKNFFVMVSAEFKVEKDSYTFEEILAIIQKSLKEQITKEHLEKLFSYNVSNEKKIIARAVPLFVKNIAIRHVYRKAALANTTTITNVGNVTAETLYKPYIERFGAYLAMSKGQLLKGTICSYDDTLMFTFSSILRDTSVQKGFFRKLSEDGLDVVIESNGVYYE